MRVCRDVLPPTVPSEYLTRQCDRHEQCAFTFVHHARSPWIFRAPIVASPLCSTPGKDDYAFNSAWLPRLCLAIWHRCRVVAGSPQGPTAGATSILSYSEPCTSRNGNRTCTRVPQYGHDGDTITVTVNGQSRVLPFGNAANDLGRVFRERKANTVNFGVREYLQSTCCLLCWMTHTRRTLI